MKKPLITHHDGFTLIEIMLVIAIVALLGGLAVVAYKGYITEAETAELTDRIAKIREQVLIDAKVEGVDLCASPPASLVRTSLEDPFVQMSVVTHDLRYAKPLALQVRADHAGGNVKVARQVFESMKGDSHIGPNPVITNSAVSFTVLLIAEPCTQPKQPASQCPPGQTAYTLFVSSFSGPKATYCLDTCNDVVDEVGRCCAQKDMTGGRWCSGSYTESKRHSQVK